MAQSLVGAYRAQAHPAALKAGVKRGFKLLQYHQNTAFKDLGDTPHR